MRCLLAVLALGVVVPGYALDFYSRGARLPDLVRKLEAETGKKLLVSPELDNDVVYVNVKGVEAEALLAHIAQVADAKWKLSGETMTLEADSARRKRQATEELEKARKEYLDNLDFKELEGDDEDEIRTEFVRLLKSMPKSVFGQNFPNRTVLSSNPTRAQYGLRSSAQGLVDAMVKQQNMMAEAVDGSDGQMEMMMGMMGTVMEALGIKKEDLIPQPVTTRPAKLLIIVNPASGNQAYYRQGIEARLYDENGKQIATAGLDNYAAGRAVPVPVEEMEGEEGASEEGTPPPPDNSPVIEYREESKKLLTTGRDFSNASFTTNRVIPEEIKTWIHNPQTYEPLSFMASDAWDAWAKHHNKNVVVSVDDSSAGLPTYFEAAPNTLDQFQGSINATYTISEVAGVTLITPQRPHQSRQNRMSRTVMSNFIQSSIANAGVPELNSWAAYVDSKPIDAEQQGMTAYYEQWAGADGLITAQMPGHEFSLRLWNRLSANHRASMLQGQDLPLRNLGSRASELIAHYVYNSPDVLQEVRPPLSGANRFISMMTFGISGAFGSKGNIAREPTEMFPTGLPNNGFIRPFVTSDSMVVPVTPQGETMQMIRALSSDELALFDMITQTPGFAEGGGGMPRLDQFRLGKRQLVDFQVMLSPQCQMPGSFVSMKVDPKSEIFSRANFPQSLRDEVARAGEDLKKSGLMNFFQAIGAEGGFGGGGQARP